MSAFRPALALLLSAVLAACASPAPQSRADLPAVAEQPAVATAELPAPTEPLAAAEPAPEPPVAMTAPAVEPPAPDPLATLEGVTRLACRSDGVLVAGQTPSDLVYDCEGVDQGVSLDALREAGWQLQRLGIGAQAEHEGERGLPLTLTLGR